MTCRCDTRRVPSGSFEPAVVVLTTSEGRDKGFKALQCALKLAAWALVRPGLFPDGNSEFRFSWVDRLMGNVHTIRNGRALFKLGRWVITLIDLLDLIPRLVSESNRGKKVVLALIALRCVLAIVRNTLRDFVNLSTKKLFGLHLTEVNRLPLERIHAVVASVSWLLIALIDFGLIQWRLWHREWVPPASCVPCECASGTKRLCFQPLDLRQCCPSVRNVEFVDAVPPSAMSASCRLCGHEGHVGKCETWPARTGAALLFPRVVSSTLYTIDVVKHHSNFREALLLGCKSVFDLIHASCCATMVLPESQELKHTRWLVGNACGLLSSLIAVRRVWLSPYCS